MQITENEACVTDLKLKILLLKESICQRQKETEVYKELFWMGLNAKAEKSGNDGIDIGELLRNDDESEDENLIPELTKTPSSSA